MAARQIFRSFATESHARQAQRWPRRMADPRAVGRTGFKKAS